MTSDTFTGVQLANYRLQHRIGRGGMATVYLAEDVSLKRQVAVKLIDARYQGQPEYARRFVDEAQIVARWRHDNIMQVYYAGQQDEIYFFAMEYVEGLSLSELLGEYAAAGELMPHSDVLTIGRAIARALDYAHAQGVIHRDVKPSNVLIGRDDRVILTDFGLALDVQRGTLGEIFGTPHYISPEQARSSAAVVPQSDLYSLAVILYEMVTGKVPFDDPSITTLAVQHMTMPVPRPRSLNPSLNVQTENVLLKALSKDPEERYETGAALLDALEAALYAPYDEPDNDETLLPPVDDTGSLQRTLSRQTVADKVAARMTAIPPVMTDTTAPHPSPPTEPAPSSFKIDMRLVAGAAAAVMVIGLIVVLLLASGILSPAPEETQIAAGNEAETPTIAAEAVDEVDEAEEATAAPVIQPTDEPPPPTEQPTIAVTFSITDRAPTRTPVDFATPEPQTTATDAGAPPANTPVTDGRPINLLWDEYSFYVHNATGVVIQANRIAFEGLDTSGNATGYAFNGGRWAQFYGLIETNRCDAIEVGRAPAYLRPPECSDYNAYFNPTPDDESVFWTGNGGTASFRVLWDGAEVGQCAIADGTCQVRVRME